MNSDKELKDASDASIADAGMADAGMTDAGMADAGMAGAVMAGAGLAKVAEVSTPMTPLFGLVPHICSK